MVTPSQYKKRYESIDVLLENGDFKTVSVNKYRLAGSNDNAKARDEFRRTLAKRGIDVELQIETAQGIVYVDPRLTESQRTSRLASDTRVDARLTDWDKLSRLVFAGKGSPEACQAVLQLANHWGLAPDVQAYADSALGLDCNGFVGNFLRHGQQLKPWTSLASDHELGPDSPIRTGFYDRYQHRLLDRWEALNTAKTYIMLEADPKTGVVINGGTAASAGHIVITEPNGRRDLAGKGGTKSFAVGVVESTASHTPPGLSENWYTCVKYDSKTKIFTIDRGKDIAGERRQISFKIAAVS